MTVSRRSLLKLMAGAAGGAMLGSVPVTRAAPRYVSHRPPPGQRRFVSPAVEALIARKTQAA